MQLTVHSTAKSQPMPFVMRMFDETMELLLIAQEYFGAQAPYEHRHAKPVEKLVFSSEMSRVTLRLSSIMAWLLARRAEGTGEITREEAAAQFRLAFSDICLRDLPERRRVLSPAMCELLERSLALYRRAFRLDSLIDIDADPVVVH